MYSIEILVNAQNQALYDAVTSQLEVRLSPTPSGDGYWAAAIENGNIGMINWDASEHPLACFTHELLHLKFDLAGKAKPAFQVSAHVNSQVEFKTLEAKTGSFMNYAYNQLIHRKMYPEFIGMGFRADQFTADPNSETLDKVASQISKLRQLKRSGKALTLFDWGFPFILLMDPSDNSKRARELLGKLKGIMLPTDAAKMSQFFREFDADKDPSMPLVLAKLLSFVPNATISFGYSQDSLVCWPPCASKSKLL